VTKILDSIIDAVGNTPLVRINRLLPESQVEIVAKLEFLNPLSSIKDRVGKAMIEDALDAGLINAQSVIIEPTSGNTGIALAFVAAVKGLKLILTMPETMSIERRSLLKGLGAEVILTPANQGMHGAVSKAYALAETTENAIVLQQFSNPANPSIHARTTAEEIWSDTQGEIDALVAGIGTGGSISGIGNYLKSKNSEIRVFGVEPSTSAVINGARPGPHEIQGIGAGFIPDNLDLSIIDECLEITDAEAFDTARKLARLEGIPAGISSGATCAAALKIAKRPEFNGKRIVVIFASCAERYLSTRLYRDLLD
jgi:cysteine synthase A